MRIEQVAVQLYTLRDHLATPGEIISTLRKLRAIGYQAVETFKLSPMTSDEWARALKDEGLICCGAHENPDDIVANPDRVIERLEGVGCRFAAYPYPKGVPLETLDDIKTLAARLNASGKILHDAGYVLAYHNHGIEFRRIEGKLIIDVLFEETNPDYMKAEIDTYWVQYGGQNPVDWCKRLKGRLPLLHLKDYMLKDNGTSNGIPSMTEIGRGNLDWKAIIEAAEESSCRWFIVEQDVCPGDPFESIRLSFEHITQHLCQQGGSDSQE